MKYVILTFAMHGLSGGPLYANNKVKWLKENGIDPVVFDHYGSLKLLGEIVLEYLLPYKRHRMLELFFPPSYFSKSQRSKILDRLCQMIGEADDYVVESNSSRLALWGELLAERLHAKHLLLYIGEHLTIRTEEEYRYLNFKLNRRELFTIKPKTMQNLFEGYKKISDEEANNLFFAALMGVKAVDIPMPEIDNLPEANYRILSFGRYKPYFENMIEGVLDFCKKHSSERVNFLIMGKVDLPASTKSNLESVSNLYVKFIPAMRPLPKAVFDYSDVVIATAGCANISNNQDVKTISMDVETCMPLGVMGYTTTDSVYSTNPNQPKYEVCDLLEDILVNHCYDGEQLLKKKGSGKGFDFQMGLINNDRLYWPDVEKIVFDNGLRRLIETIVLRCGGIRLFAKKIGV